MPSITLTAAEHAALVAAGDQRARAGSPVICWHSPGTSDLTVRIEHGATARLCHHFLRRRPGQPQCPPHRRQTLPVLLRGRLPVLLLLLADMGLLRPTRIVSCWPRP